MASTYVRALTEAQNHYCCYCHHELPYNRKQQTERNQPTKDHVEPRCHGGATAPDNLVMACAQCNHIRGAMKAEVFYELLWYWFSIDPTLRQRWHHISRREFAERKRECIQIHQIQWERRLKKCVAARLLHTVVPLPFLPQHSQT